MATVGRKRLRGLWFSVHKWIGLLLMLLLIPISATGSLLVWTDWTDGLVNPQRYQVSEQTASLAPSAYANAARAVLRPDDRIASIAFPEEPGKPVVVTASRTPAPGAEQRPGPPPRYTVWLDPATAQIVDHADPGTGILRTLHVLHGSLMVPGVGRKIVGWLGWAMFASCLTGIWLWWPTIGSALRGFRWKRGRLFSGNLHHQVGIWIAIPLAVLSFTGAYISFPDFFRSVTSTIAGAPAGKGDAPRGPRQRPRPRPLADPMLTPDAALVAAGAGPAAVLSIRYPTERNAEWTLSLRSSDEEVAVDDRSGRILPSEGKEGPAAERTARLMRIVHDGHETNPVWQTIIFVAGLAPLVLGVTGLIMWLRNRGWRVRVASRAAA